jgi:hypothetical protein
MNNTLKIWVEDMIWLRNRKLKIIDGRNKGVYYHYYKKHDMPYNVPGFPILIMKDEEGNMIRKYNELDFECMYSTAFAEKEYYRNRNDGPASIQYP